MNRRRFLRNLGLGGVAAWFFQMPAVASTLESCHQALSDIRDIALDTSLGLQERLDLIVAIVDGEIGPLQPSISGDFSGTVPAGETWKITGDVNLTGDLIVEGTLTSVDTFTLEGNGYQILVQNGGRLDLAGKPKTAWVSWGDPVSGWEVGDSLVVATTSIGTGTEHQDPKTSTWQGDWPSTVKPSSAVTLVDGSVAEPEVANISKTAQINNVSRVMFHMSPGVSSIRDVAVTNAGISDAVDFYPLHWHLNGDATRGTTVTDVVVVDSANRAFVPHSSHGITFAGCAAVRGVDTQFWWNEQDATHDTTYDRCLVLGQQNINRGAGTRYHAFRLGQGNGNRALGCVATGMYGGQWSGAFLWPEADSADWIFEDCVSHNNRANGLIHYSGPGDIVRFAAYRNLFNGLEQLTYVNSCEIRDVALSENHQKPVGSKTFGSVHAKGVHNSNGQPPIFQNVTADTSLVIGMSQATAESFVPVVSCSFPDGVDVRGEPFDTSDPSRGRLLWEFTDCGLTPTDFTFDGDGGPESVFSIVESGVEVYRYENQTWI